MPQAQTPMLDVKAFFEIDSTAQFGKEWRELDSNAKDQLKSGVANGSLTY